MAPQTGNPNQVSDWKIKLSYWYVSHKLGLRQALVGFLILLSLGFYGYTLYRALMIFLVDDKAWNQDSMVLTTNLTDYAYFRAANKPEDLQIISFDALGGKDNRYDFIAKVANVNDDWIAAQVDFQLVVGAEVVAEKTSFVYPGEEKYLAFFGQEITSGFNPILKINRVGWHRFNNFSGFGESRLNFEVSDIKFRSARESGIRGDLPVSTLSFTIKNNTAFSYWHLGLYIGLVNVGRPFAANFILLDQFLSGESREVEIRWYESIPSAGQVEIFPEVNILSSESYMPVE